MSELDVKSKEQLILESAEYEFLTKGYDGARTTSIAKSAGVTHAMLHYYFRTKEQLFERILDEKFSVMLQSVLSMFGDSSLSLVERIRSGVALHFDFVAANPLIPGFVIREILSRPERTEMLMKKVYANASSLFVSLQKEIDEAAGRGEIVQIDVRMLLIDILSLNVFTFLAYPILEPVMGGLMMNDEQFLQARKAENIEVIMRRIKKY